MSADKNTSVLLGDPKKALIHLAIPIIFALIVAQANVIADRAWVSRLGVDAMSAVAIVAPIYNILVGLGTGLGVGVSAVISRYIGSGDTEKAKKSAIQALIILLVFALVLVPVMVVIGNSLMDALAPDQHTGDSLAYLNVYSFSIAPIMLVGVLGGIMNGQGASRNYSMMMVSLAVSNIILDPIFIYVFDLGVMGAAVATVVSTFIAIGVGLCMLQSGRLLVGIDRSMIGFDKTSFFAVLTAGFPQMLEYVIMYGFDTVFNYYVVKAAGSVGMTVFSAVDSITLMAVVPAMAIGSAIVPIASSAYGQRDQNRLISTIKYGFIYAVSIEFVIVSLFQLFPEQALYVFTYSGEAAEHRQEMVAIAWMAWYGMAYGIIPLCSGSLQAMRHPSYSVYLAVIRNTVNVSVLSVVWVNGLEAVAMVIICGMTLGAAMAVATMMLTYLRVKKVHFNPPAAQC